MIPLCDVIEHQVPGGLEDFDTQQPTRWMAVEADPDAPELDCPCGPRTEHVPPNGWLISHHSLDGRERRER